MPTESSPLAWTDDPDRSPGYPFRGPGTFTRAAPFAGIAVLAEASLALAPSPASPWTVAVSLALLVAVAASFALPWERLPTRLKVLVPLAYTGSALALTLAAGTTSGVGIVILVPLIWTALFHRRWESGCIVVAIVAAMVVISLTPVAVADAVFARRVILWAALASVITFAAHELRDRSYNARQEAVALQARLTELTVVRDRDRIAADLQDTVIQQVFAAGMNLHSTAMLATEPGVRKRILTTVDHLDDVLRLTRNAVFGLERRKQDRGLRAEIIALCATIFPVPEVVFTGPVDGALDPAHATQLVRTLRDALNVISPHAAAARVAVTANDTTCIAEIEATGSFPDPDETRAWPARFAKSMTGPGISFRIQPVRDGMRLTWSIPIASSSARPPSADPVQQDLGLAAALRLSRKETRQMTRSKGRDDQSLVRPAKPSWIQRLAVGARGRLERSSPIRLFLWRLGSLDFVNSIVLFGAALLISVLPFIILLSSLANQRIDTDLSRHIGLDRQGARIVSQLFRSSPTHSATAIVTSLILATAGTMAVASSLQLIYERVFGQQHRGWKDTPRFFAWAGVMFGALVADSVIGAFLRTVAGAPAQKLVTYAGVAAFFLWTMHFLLAGRVSWRLLVRPAIVTALLWIILDLFASVYFSSQIVSDSRLYGTIGAVFGLMTWFIAIGAVILLGAVAGATWDQRKRRSPGAGP